MKLTNLHFCSVSALDSITHVRLDRENLAYIDNFELLGERVTNLYLQKVTNIAVALFWKLEVAHLTGLSVVRRKKRKKLFSYEEEIIINLKTH